MRHRRRMHAARDQAGEVRHVHHEQRADFLRDRGERGEVDDARVRAPARDDQLGLLRPRQVAHLVVVDEPAVLAHAVLHGLEQLA